MFSLWSISVFVSTLECVYVCCVEPVGGCVCMILHVESVWMCLRILSERLVGEYRVFS